MNWIFHSLYSEHRLGHSPKYRVIFLHPHSRHSFVVVKMFGDNLSTPYSIKFWQYTDVVQTASHWNMKIVLEPHDHDNVIKAARLALGGLIHEIREV